MCSSIFILQLPAENACAFSENMQIQKAWPATGQLKEKSFQYPENSVVTWSAINKAPT
jgi:hypothetical protein